jgi:hypothetical protein
MKVTFSKGAGKFDRMEFKRADGRVEVVACPKQRIIPHEMVHYAVESTLNKRGFMSRIGAGEEASVRMAGNTESDGVERLVEVFQGDAWSGGDSAVEDMLDLYQVTCRARSCPALSVTAADMRAIRARIEQLDRQWRALPVGESLVLDIQADGGLAGPA